MTVFVRSFAAVLADTSVFCNVAAVLDGDGLITILEYLDKRVLIVQDVHREMDGLSIERFPDLAILKTVEMVREYLRVPPVALDPDLAGDVPGIVQHSGLFTPDPERPRKNYGEVATVLAARRLGIPVLMDDGDGRKFARLRGLSTSTTRDLVVQMHVDGVLSADDAFGVWSVAAKRNRERDSFERAVKAARGV
jgi:predicted nucleic acid-binding protein